MDSWMDDYVEGWVSGQMDPRGVNRCVDMGRCVNECSDGWLDEYYKQNRRLFSSLRVRVNFEY